MNAGHAQVALRKSSTEYADSSKQEQEEPHARTVMRHALTPLQAVRQGRLHDDRGAETHSESCRGHAATRLDAGAVGCGQNV